MLALLDGDIYAASENDPLDIALFRVTDSIEQTLAAVGATEYQVWLSDKRENNFRRLIMPEYKANRKQPDPLHLADVKAHLIDKWGASVTLGQEADDALGIEQSKREFGSTIICSIDKDLKQVPGRHYNFVRQEFDDVSPVEGLRWFYKQMLIGDTSDNIKGVDRIGPVKAGKLLDHVEDEWEMYERVSAAYGSQDQERMLMNGKVLWIRQKENQTWDIPIERSVA
jgi:DNA polymerase I